MIFEEKSFAVYEKYLTSSREDRRKIIVENYKQHGAKVFYMWRAIEAEYKRRKSIPPNGNPPSAA